MGYLQPRSAKVVLDAAGQGAVTFAIEGTNQRWIIDLMTVSTSQAALAMPFPSASVYTGVISPQTFIGGSSSGNSDTAQGRAVMYPDDALIIQWTGGIPGTTATAVILGTFTAAGEPLKD